MFFNSYPFLLFLPVIIALYFSIPGKFKWLLLLTGSCLFYAFYKPEYLILFAAIITLSYWGGLRIEGAKSEKEENVLLAICCILLVGLLAFFRYPEIIASSLKISGKDWSFFENILFPIGLSFHTFQAISYLTDVARKEVPAERHFGHYSLFILFFPRIMNGPIERAGDLLPQLKIDRSFSKENLLRGFSLVLWGLIKKTVIADRLGLTVDDVYNTYTEHSGLTLAIAILFYTFQLYCDFSGYTDIALGSARMLGVQLTDNFNFPFRSKNMSDFWRRWHISLSTWFNDYVFNPIVVNRRNWGSFAIVFGLVVTFALSGIWHGAKWTFLIYGIMHGGAVAYEFLTTKFRKRLAKKFHTGYYVKISGLLTLLYVSVSWIFFRSDNLSQANYVLSHVLQPTSSDYLTQKSTAILMGFALIAGLELSHYFLKERKFDAFILEQNPMTRLGLFVGSGMLILFAGDFSGHPFIYFRF